MPETLSTPLSEVVRNATDVLGEAMDDVVAERHPLYCLYGLMRKYTMLPAAKVLDAFVVEWEADYEG